VPQKVGKLRSLTQWHRDTEKKETLRAKRAKFFSLSHCLCGLSLLISACTEKLRTAD
jgi:hypothetical protein